MWTGSNHDVSRLATRWAGGDPDRARVALLVLLTLRGTPVLYQGDEIGLVDGPIGREDARRPGGPALLARLPGPRPRAHPAALGPRARGRVHRPGGPTWLPMADPAENNVADQRADPASVLWLVRDLSALRRRTPALASGDYRSLAAPPGAWCYARRMPGAGATGHGAVVAANLSASAVTVEVGPGRVALATDRRHDGDAVDGPLHLGPYEGAVLVGGRR